MPVLGKFLTTRPAARAAQSPESRDAVVFGQDLYRNPPPPAAITSGAERICGAPGCVGRWSMPWKNRRRPIFEQEWGCSPRCLSELVQAAVARETGKGLRSTSDEPHRHRVPLGLVLLAQGWITHPQLQSALDAQRTSGRGRIGDWLAEGCGLEEERVARGVGMQWNCPVLSVDGFSPSAMALVMPQRFVVEFGLVPLRIAGSRLLYVAFEEQMNAATALGVERMSGLKVESGVLTGAHFAMAKASILAADAVPVEVKQVADRDALAEAIVRALNHHQPLAARLVRVHQYYWLRMWLESGAMAGKINVPSGSADMRDCLFMMK